MNALYFFIPIKKIEKVFEQDIGNEKWGNQIEKLAYTIYAIG
jgi:hypothetical protein